MNGESLRGGNCNMHVRADAAVLLYLRQIENLLREQVEILNLLPGPHRLQCSS
jgi:hypothetical protein